MSITLDLAPGCQLDKFQNKLNSTKGEVATFIFSPVSEKIIRPDKLIKMIQSELHFEL